MRNPTANQFKEIWCAAQLLAIGNIERQINRVNFVLCIASSPVLSIHFLLPDRQIFWLQEQTTKRKRKRKRWRKRRAANVWWITSAGEWLLMPDNTYVYVFVFQVTKWIDWWLLHWYSYRSLRQISANVNAKTSDTSGGYNGTKERKDEKKNNSWNVDVAIITTKNTFTLHHRTDADAEEMKRK